MLCHNNWGFSQQTGTIIMLRCPLGYCCHTRPCQNINYCSKNRGGTFCGRCKSGFTEAIFSSHCIQDSNCNNLWFFGVYVGWIVFSFAFLFIFQHIFCFIRKLLKCFLTQHEGSPGMRKRDQWIAQIINLDSNKEIAFLLIAMYFYQDTSWLQVKLPAELKTLKPKFRDFLFRVSHWSLDTIGFSDKLCVWSGMTPSQKVFLKMCVPVSVLFLFTMFFLLTIPLKDSSRKKTLCLSLASGFLVGILVFYQSIANMLFSFVSCVKLGETHVLYLDGTVECFEWWQILVVILIIFWVFPFIAILSVAQVLLANQMIPASEFFLSCLFPLGLLLWWFIRKLRNQWHKEKGSPTPWYIQAVKIVQVPFRNTCVTTKWYLSWNGILFSRRLLLILVHVFTSNMIWRQLLMFCVTFPFIKLCILAVVQRPMLPGSSCLVGSLVVNMTNLVKAVILQNLTENEDAENVAGYCENVIDSVLVLIPMIISLGFLFAHLWRLIRAKRKDCEENQVEVVVGNEIMN